MDFLGWTGIGGGGGWFESNGITCNGLQRPFASL